jgi:hypothetical protein
MVEVSFEGDQVAVASTWEASPDGYPYTTCTTVKYGYRPAFNSITLTVGPQGSLLTLATKTPEQVQQEAEASGWLSV